MTFDTSTPEHETNQEPLTPNQRWERDFPKTYPEADAKLRQAQSAYYGLAMPQGDFRDTQPFSLTKLLAQRDRQELQIRELNDQPPPFLENVFVPQGFEKWAVEKIRLASPLWQAHAMRSIYM